MTATVAAVLEPTPWMTHAACRGMNPNLFFPGRGESPDAAIAVCRRCPVTHHCLMFAVRHRLKAGVWGGQAEQDRRRLYPAVPPASRQRLAFHGTPGRYRQGCRCESCRHANTTRWVRAPDEADPA